MHTLFPALLAYASHPSEAIARKPSPSIWRWRRRWFLAAGDLDVLDTAL